MPVVHEEVVVVPDDPTYPVGSDEWNSDHLYDGGAAGDVLTLGAIVDTTRRAIVAVPASTFGPGGADTEVQFNDGGVFGGDAGFTYNKTTKALTLAEATSGVRVTPIAGTVFFVGEGSATDIGLHLLSKGAGDITLNSATGGVIVSNRVGTPATMAAFTAGGVLTETTLPTGGVTSIAGTANQITASAATGAVTLSLPSALVAPGSLTVTTRTGTPATMAVFTSAGLLAETTLPTGTGTVTHTAGALTASALVVGNGSDDVKVLASLGTTTTVLHGNAAGLPTFGAVVLTTDVSGVLPVANGGTALSTTPTNGQLLIGNGTNYTLAAVTAGKGTSITNGAGTITVGLTASWCSATKAAAQSLTNNTETSVVYDTESADTDAYHDTVTNNTRFTAPFTGVFHVLGQGDFASNATGLRFVVLRQDGTTYITAFITQAATSSGGVGLVAEAVVALTAGQYIELRAFQNSGGSLNFTPRMTITYVGA